MPVEFALRPRIRLREDVRRPRRSLLRLPLLVSQIALYWLAVGGIVYAFVRTHEPASANSAAIDRAGAAETAQAPNRAWWRPLSAAPTELEPARVGATSSAESAPSPETASPNAPSARVEPPSHDLAVATNDSARLAPRQRAELSGELERRNPPPRAASARDSMQRPLAAPDFAPASPEPEPEPAPNFPRAAAGSEARAQVGGALPGCEAALAASQQDVDFSQGDGVADLPSQSIAAVLDGPWIASCNVPSSSAVEVCVAIRGGRVIGASVSTRPTDRALRACIERRAAALQFPYSAHVDLARTRF